MPRAWYCPQSQSENGESRPTWNPSVRSQNVRTALQRLGLEQEDREREQGRDANPPRTRRPSRRSRRVGQPERRQQQGRELRPAGERDGGPTPRGGGAGPEAPDERRRHDRVVRVRVEDVRGERVREPGEREHRGEARAAEAQADEHEPEHDQEIEGNRRGMRRRERVPSARPAERQHRGHVGEVGDRAVRVAPRVRGLAAAVLLDALADLPVRVRRATGSAAVLDGHVAVGGLAVEDPVGADHAGVADVDHAARRLEVEADPEAGKEDGRCDEQPDRPDRRGRVTAPAEPDPQGARQEVARGGAASGALRKISPRLKNQSERPNESSTSRSSVCSDLSRRRSTSPTRNRTLNGEPHPPCVQRLAAERARAAARHLPRDLRAGPSLRDETVGVRDLARGDLPGCARPDVHRPAPRRTIEDRIGARVPAGSGRASARPCGTRAERATACCSVSLGASGDGANGASMSRPPGL